MSLVKRVRGIVGYVFYLAVVLLAAQYFLFFRPFVAEMRERLPGQDETFAVPPNADLELIRRVGALRVGKTSSFSEISIDAPPERRRICAFGDSYTYGSEVGPHHDFPSQLGVLLAERGANAEVVNFGSPWHGFHQTFMIWEQMADRFGCDDVLLGPSGFHTDRDTEMNHTGWIQPYYIHARYVLDGAGDVRLVEVPGDDQEARFDNYFSYPFSWRFARYSRTTPPFFQSMLPAGRRLDNPFYYRSDRAILEAKETYRILLARMADSGTDIHCGNYLRHVVDAANGVEAANLRGFLLSRPLGFPHTAPQGHNSAWGNRVLAEQYLGALTRTSTPEINVFATRPVEAGEGEGATAPWRRPISSYQAIGVQLDGVDIGRFVDGSPGNGFGGMPSDLMKDTVALVGLKAPGDSILDGTFVTVPADLTPETTATLRIELPGETLDLPLGTVDLLAGTLNLGTVDLAGVSFAKPTGLTFAGNQEVDSEHLGQARSVEILIGSQPLLRGHGEGEGPARLMPVEGAFRILRVTGPELDTLPDLPLSGTFALKLEHPTDGNLTVPVATLQTKTVPGGERD